MLLLGALVVFFIVGFWLYCLVDVALTPSIECPRLPKAAWLVVVAVTFVIGAVLWLAVRPAGGSQLRPA
jgi:Phospholipase_D-nuclease N-terminal